LDRIGFLRRDPHDVYHRSAAIGCRSTGRVTAGSRADEVTDLRMIRVVTQPDTTADLPTDATCCVHWSMMAERDAWTPERVALVAERGALVARNERLHHILLKLNRPQFGRRRGGEARSRAAGIERAAALPAHLPRAEMTLLLETPRRGAMTVIGTDSSERLDVVPAQYRVLVTHCPKLACRSCEGSIVQSPAPPRLIEGGIPTEALVAHVAVARYADHQNRQAQMMARQGVLLDRSMLAF